MRRKDREITDFTEMLKALGECDCCRLGLVDENEAYIVPMSFGYEVTEGQLNLYFHCAGEGRKIDLISRNQTASFEADTAHLIVRGDTGCDFSARFKSVMGVGTVSIISNVTEKIYGLEKIMEHYTDRADWSFDRNALEKTTVLKLSVRSWSCKIH